MTTRASKLFCFVVGEKKMKAEMTNRPKSLSNNDPHFAIFQRTIVAGARPEMFSNYPSCRCCLCDANLVGREGGCDDKRLSKINTENVSDCQPLLAEWQ